MTGADPNRIELELEIVNEQGLHMRPVMRLTEAASQFKCDLRVNKEDRSADLRSPFEMMLLEAPKGTRLRLVATGEDAQAAVAAIVQIVQDKFGEP